MTNQFASMMTRRTTYLAAAVLLFFFAGCDLLDTSEENLHESLTASVFVANQGNFGDGNGSVSVYDPHAQQVDVNAIADLGSIIQSIMLIQDRLFVMSNTAERVDVFSYEGLAQVAQIDGVDSPRYAARVAEDKAYVTGLGDFAGEQGTVTAIELSTNEVLAEIEVGGNPEGIAYLNGRAFVATGGYGVGDTITIVDVASDEVVDTVSAECDTPRHVFAITNHEMLVVCIGSILYDEDFTPVDENPGALRVLDATTGEILARENLDDRLATVGSGQDAYLVPETGKLFAVRSDNSVLRISTTSLAVEEELGPFEGDPIGAVTYDVVNERMYLGRVPGFDQNGTVTVHSADGTEVNSFDVGVAPSHILVVYETE